MNTSPPSASKWVAYIDVFSKGRGKILLVANDIQHRELWRRDDPGAASVLANYRRAGKVEIYIHNR